MFQQRRLAVVIIISTLVIGGVVFEAGRGGWPAATQPATQAPAREDSALAALEQLPVKGRAAKTGYARKQFGDGWQQMVGCDVRNKILARDMTNVVTASPTDCTVVSGNLHDPYTDKLITFVRGPDTSDDVQIDHVIALSDAWQKGAQQLAPERRQALANDPLNLLAVDGPTNNAKGDSDAATWLPPNKAFRCRYVARQVAVKTLYELWVTQAEWGAMKAVLGSCPAQELPKVH